MIKVKDLYFSYPKGEHILKGIDVHIRPGEYVAILGENGSGKSTLARHFNGLLVPTGGYVEIRGMNTKDTSCIQEIRKSVGMVFQDPFTQFVGANVEEDVAFGPTNLCWPREKVIEAVRSALESIGLSELKNSPPLELSGGQMQLAAIAGVLAMQPDCIVFDEATSMLDMTTKAKVFNLIHNLHKEGKTILHITHNITEASHAERIILLGGGNIILDKGTAQFMEYASMKIPGFEAPPILELSIGLKKAGILQTYTVDMDKIVEEICHFRSEH